jgi:prolyl-tRNA editing enzyme YbaK/EbsC (Cys-tRNA(Pro) deacylase)
VIKNACEEAAAAKGVHLFKELKTLIVETSSGLIAVHLPGDARLSLRAVKVFLEAEEAYVADPETLLGLGLSPGTVSAILDAFA